MGMVPGLAMAFFRLFSYESFLKKKKMSCANPVAQLKDSQ
jgi:hypothetical protein